MRERERERERREREERERERDVLSGRKKYLFSRNIYI